MKFTQIRNATAHISYGGKKFLLDPVFAPKDAYPGFKETLNGHLNWPTVVLPFSIEDMLKVDAVIVTHTHPDHFDEVAMKEIPKDMPMFVQNSSDKEIVANAGFTNITIMGENSSFENIKLSITKGQHGSNEAMEACGELLGVVSGVVLSCENEKTVYIAGDTVWNEYVEDAINKYTPDIMILNAGDAQLADGSSIIMGKEDTLKAHNANPNAIIIATHMEAVGHSTISRKELIDFTKENNIEKFVLVPEDGETVEV